MSRRNVNIQANSVQDQSRSHTVYGSDMLRTRMNTAPFPTHALLLSLGHSRSGTRRYLKPALPPTAPVTFVTLPSCYRPP